MDVVAMDSPTLIRKRKEKHPPHLYTAFLSALDNISGPPIWVVNDVDSEPCPPLVFKWTEDYQFGPGVPPRDEHFSHGCTCPGDECDLRDPNACECLEYSDEKNFAYDANGLIHHPPGGAIFECNDICGCGRTCPNRVVQRGRRMPLEIFKTEKKGWGIILVR
jgi:histone-lysine N-methyltransferase SUV39H